MGAPETHEATPLAGQRSVPHQLAPIFNNESNSIGCVIFLQIIWKMFIHDHFFVGL